jgi:hypothetical protein
MRPVLAALSTAALLTLGGPALADAPQGPPPGGGWNPKGGIAVGPSLGYAGGRFPHSFAGGAEVSFSWRLNMPLFWWISGGARTWIAADEKTAIPYLETGLSLLYLVLGAGYGAGLPSGPAPAHCLHGHAGLSFPLWSPAHGKLLHAGPYYRPVWDVSGPARPACHEVGLMIKWWVQLSPLRRE